MKKWIKGLAITTIIVGVSLGGAYYLGVQYKLPTYIDHVVKKNVNLSNYEREFSISLAFDKQKGKDDNLFSTLDGSILVIHENTSNQNHSIDYNLSNQGEEFVGKQVYTFNDLVVKSPMYHRYIDFYESPFVKEPETKLVYIQDELLSFLKKTRTGMKVYRDIGGNEKGVKTLSIKGQNQAVKKSLITFIDNFDNGFPYQSILYNNELVTNKLLKEHLSNEEIQQKFSHIQKSLQQRINSILANSRVTDSVISIKITKKQVIKEGSATIKMVYTSPGTKEEIPFTLYINLNTWNINKAKVKPIETDPTNSIMYKNMTDKINYFDNENFKNEDNAYEDKEHVQKGFNEDSKIGFKEKTSTLKELGDNFTPVIPDKR